MNIRLATLNDIDAICTLYQQFYETNSKQQPKYYCNVEENGSYPKSVINGTSGDIFIAETQYKIIGFIHVEAEKTAPFPSVAPHNYACIVDFYVIPNYRRNGTGKALLESAKNWAKSKDLEYLELFVLEENQVGQNFYKRENFRIASRTLRYVL